MVTMLEIKAAYDSAKAAVEIAKGYSALKTEAAKNAAIIDVQQHVVEAQQGLSAALHRINELEQEIARLEDWSAEKKRYELAEAGRGSFAYRLKEGVESPEPPHWICPQCYQKG